MMQHGSETLIACNLWLNDRKRDLKWKMILTSSRAVTTIAGLNFPEASFLTCENAIIRDDGKLTHSLTCPLDPSDAVPKLKDVSHLESFDAKLKLRCTLEVDFNM